MLVLVGSCRSEVLISSASRDVPCPNNFHKGEPTAQCLQIWSFSDLVNWNLVVQNTILSGKPLGAYAKVHLEYIHWKAHQESIPAENLCESVSVKNNNPGLFDSIFVFHWHFSRGLLLLSKLFPEIHETDPNLFNHLDRLITVFVGMLEIKTTSWKKLAKASTGSSKSSS